MGNSKSAPKGKQLANARFDTAAKTRQLILKSAKLKKVPPRTFQLGNLKTLDLSLNLLEELPPEMKNLVALSSLVVSENKLERLPAELGTLPKLDQVRRAVVVSFFFFFCVSFYISVFLFLLVV